MAGWVKNIEEETKKNASFRTAVFTGKYLQLTLMSIKPGEDVGLEVHADVDQFLRIESGAARVTFGLSKDEVTEEYEASDDWAIIVPAGTWHNIINTGQTDLKLYSIYAPPNHPDGTIHHTKSDADTAEAAEHHP